MRSVFTALAFISLLVSDSASSFAADRFRPPAVPLIACDPYFSVWSPATQLNEKDTVHWTGKSHRLTGLIRIDGKVYRWMGAGPEQSQALEQTACEVRPTTSVYQFKGSGIELNLKFFTPALPEDLSLLSRPTTYVTYEIKATDGQKHEVDLYLDASGELAVNVPTQEVQGKTELHGPLTAARIGSVKQPVLAKRGDDLRIDWGYLYVAALSSNQATSHYGSRSMVQQSFLRNTALEKTSEEDSASASDQVVAAITMKVGTVSQQPVLRWMLLAYDDQYSIQYMKQNLRPYWRKDGWEATDLLQAAAREYGALVQRGEAFDRELMSDLSKAGGQAYAEIGALAYRQCFAAGKFVADANGQPLQFSKENHSNGCIATSDVFYPMAPQFLLFGPTLSKSFLVPFMNYAASPRWKFPFAPHDLGTYPKANGQVYGGGERTEENQMPVEESGNLLLLITAVAQMEGNTKFAETYWKQLEQWAEYLKAKGFDPENQLCTDDFAGHLAHNVNLSAKAICALGAFGKLCEMRGDAKRADEFRTIAKGFARKWMDEADSGDHYRLAFDRKNTWSQKYNLVWDRILGLDLFPKEVARKEMDFYRKMQAEYGLPLDNREPYTKLDWILWTATLTQDQNDFQSLVAPVHKFLNETPDRSPMTDWYFTHNAEKRGFTARPVVGGVFLQMLYDKPLWKKYASREVSKGDHWAPLPTSPVMQMLVETSRDRAVEWRYTTERPAKDWYQTAFSDQNWDKGQGGFGTRGTPGATVRTEWNTADIWLRRTFELNAVPAGKIALEIHHDEDCEVYLNGKLVLSLDGYTTDYETEIIDSSAVRQGTNVIAVRCHQTGGGQYIDVGLSTDVKK